MCITVRTLESMFDTYSSPSFTVPTYCTLRLPFLPGLFFPPPPLTLHIHQSVRRPLNNNNKGEERHIWCLIVRCTQHIYYDAVEKWSYFNFSASTQKPKEERERGKRKRVGAKTIFPLPSKNIFSFSRSTVWFGSQRRTHHVLRQKHRFEPSPAKETVLQYLF